MPSIEKAHIVEIPPAEEGGTIEVTPQSRFKFKAFKASGFGAIPRNPCISLGQYWALK